MDKNSVDFQLDSSYNAQMSADSGNGADALKAAKLFHSRGDNMQAVKYFAQAADAGIAEAQYMLGTYYDFGIIEEDAKKAAEYYRLAADQGYAPAQNNLGGCLRDGRGVEKNPKEAVKLFASAAEKGDANACFRIAVCLRDGIGISKNYAKAIDYLYNAANLGHIRAWEMLGDYYLGKSPTISAVPDPIRAFECYKIAAEHDSGSCMYKLGLCYRDGLGTAADREAAMNCFKLASDMGYVRATYELGNCYFDRKEYTEAIDCFNKTVNCDNPLPESMCRLAYCYITGKGVTKDINGAMWLLSRAGSEGCAEAYNLQGDCHYFGIGCDVNYAYAVKCYIEANNLGSKYAAGMLGLCFENGRGTDINMQSALTMYRKAALCGDFDGTARLGICLCRDKTTMQSGIEYLWLASSHKNIAATVELARIEYKYNPSGDAWEKYYKAAIDAERRTTDDFCGVSNQRTEMYIKNDDAVRLVAMYELAVNCLLNMCESRLRLDGMQQQKSDSKSESDKKTALTDSKNAELAKPGTVFADAYEYLGRAAIYGHEKAVAVLDNLYKSPNIGIYMFSPEFREFILSIVKNDAENGKKLSDIRNDADFAEVYNRLGEEYFKGELLKQNKSNAVKCYRIAAKLGSSGAQYSLGWCLKNGEGTAVDYEEAKKWLTVSAVAGNANACYSLGDCYDKGLGMRVRNRSEAKKWYVKAANRGNTEAARIIAAHREKE